MSTISSYVASELAVVSAPLIGYLDPGSGSILVYAIAGMIVAFGYTLKRFGYRVLNFFGGKRSQGGFTGSPEAKIIIHCEGPQYESMFLPLLTAFKGSNVDLLFVTQYERADGATPLPDDTRQVSIDNGMSGFAVLNRAVADILVTTTPQLGVLMFRRSPKVRHYAHIVHAPTDADTYEPFAFDFFDSVFCPAEFMIKSIRHLEELRGLPPKKLVDTGVLYYDSMLSNVQTTPKQQGEGKPTLLLAPSWGPNSLFARYGLGVLDTLSSDYQLIVRPHPQTKVSQPELYDSLRNACSTPNITLDEAPSGTGGMNASDLMISDFSGIIFDFTYLYEKPVIVMDTDMDYGGFEGHHLPEPLWRGRILPQLATVIEKENFHTLPEAIKAALARDPQEIVDVRDANLANFGTAAPVARQQLLEILDALPEDHA